MADPQTVNTGLAVPLRGSDPGTWDVPLNGDFSILDGFLGGVQTISASNVNILLTSPVGFVPTPSGGPTQAQNAVLRFTGVLANAVQVTLPLPGYFIIENLTTGAFVLSFRAIASGEIIAVQQGSCRHIYNDGTNVRFVNLPDVGSLLDLVTSTVPSWISACTKPPYLNCDGTTFNAATFPYLNSFLGSNTLPDLRGVARYTLNQGTARLTSAGSGLDGNTLLSLKSTESRTLLTANLPPYTPAGSVTVTSGAPPVVTVNGGSVTSATGGGAVAAISPIGSVVIQNINSFGSLTGSPQGGTSTAFGLVATGAVSGITLIRAA